MLLSLGAILTFRFVIRLQLGETAGWVAFIFLQVRRRLPAPEVFASPAGFGLGVLACRLCKAISRLCLGGWAGAPLG